METFISDFFNIFSITGMLALINIIIIDLVMSGDNAIIIGMATKSLHPKMRKKAITIGIFLATILRILLAIFAVALMNIIGLKLIGGFLLFYVVWKFYKEIRIGEGNKEELKNIRSSESLKTALWTIVIADVSMSLDNVLGVSGASHGNMAVLVIGLIFSIILMAFASNYIAKKLDDYPQIQWLGLFVILFVAMGMIVEGSHDVEKEVLKLNILPLIIFIFGSLFIFLHKKYLKPFEEEKMKEFIDKNNLKIILLFLLIIFIFLFFGKIIFEYLDKNKGVFYSILLLNFFASCEIFMYIISNKKKRINK